MEIWPPTRLTMMEGMKNGLTRRWPFCTAVRCVSSSVARPPMPEPTITPTRSPSGLSVGRAASFRAIPVTTTLRSTRCMICDLFLVLVDEVHRVLDRLDVLGLLIGDLDLEFLFHRHHQLDDVEGVGPEVFNEGGFRLDLVFSDPELFRDDALDLRLDGHGRILSWS